jgi:hypothetical protein
MLILLRQFQSISWHFAWQAGIRYLYSASAYWGHELEFEHNLFGSGLSGLGIIGLIGLIYLIGSIKRMQPIQQT